MTTNLTSLLIRALQVSPESYYFVSIVRHLDTNGNYIGEAIYEPWCVSILQNIIQYGKEYEAKYHRLSQIINSHEDLPETEMEELRRLGDLVGRCGYTELSALHRFVTWRDKVKKKLDVMGEEVTKDI